jgi:hypothetical protein
MLQLPPYPFFYVSEVEKLLDNNDEEIIRVLSFTLEEFSDDF